MVGLVAVIVLLVGLVLLGIWAAGLVTRDHPRVSARDRALEARAVQAARWSVAHDEVDGVTRVLVRRACPGRDGRPVVLEDRVFASWPSDDPLWEPRFTEAMAGARHRAAYLNAEEDA